MRVVVENITGTLFFVQVDPNATVAELKRKIGAQENLPSDRLILFLATNTHRRINDSTHDGDGNRITLANHGVHDGSHIYIFFEPLDNGSTNPFGWWWWY